MKASFSATPASGSEALTVTFTDGSSGAAGGWKWDFDDGTTTEEQNPVHTYEEPGEYTVSLTYTYSQDSEEQNNGVYTATLTVIEADGDQKQLEKTGYITVQACTTYYLDADNDGYGTDDSQCLAAPTGSYTATRSGDCNDENPAVNPGAQEVCGDGIDNNCNDEIDEGCGSVDGDLDGDGDVDTADRTLFISSLRKCTEAVGFNEDADYDGDGCVTFRDYRYWLAYYSAYLSPK